MIFLPFSKNFMSIRNRIFLRATIWMKCKPNLVKPLSYATEHCHNRFYFQNKRSDQRFLTTKSPHHDLAYQQSADSMMQSMLDFVELPEYTNFIESTNLTGDGVLEIVLNENKGTVVINKHYALKQIWYSASNSTPDYFDYDTNPPWISRRTQQSLQDRLLKDILSTST